MKNTNLKLSIVLFVSVLFTSCAIDMFDRVNGNKNVITQDRKINEDFTSIKISRGLDLYITQSDAVSLNVEADENLHEIIFTEVKNGVLNIYSDKNIWRAKAKKVHVSVKDLEELKATSGSHVYTENTLNVSNLKVATTSGANLKISVNSENIETRATSGSNLRITGRTTKHSSSATSGSSIKAYELESKNTSAKATSGANIDVHASESIEAKASSGGDIDFKGSPKQVNEKSSSGGSISAK
ncbi:MAG: head GIN domain-containing protein [Polaribacter sp.]